MDRDELIPMLTHSNHRQVWFFLVAVLLPCVVLVGLSLRMMRQERELASKRLAEERRQLAGDLRQEVLGVLERIKYEQVSALKASGELSYAEWSERGSLVLVAQLVGERPVMPWEAGNTDQGPRKGQDNVGYAAGVQEGERQEFAGRDLTKALTAYENALKAAQDVNEQAYARLLLARVRGKLAQQSGAEELYRQVLDSPPAAVDEHGVPLPYYAAAGLLAMGRGQAALLDWLEREALPCAPASLYLLLDLLDTLQQSSSSAQLAVADEMRGQVQTRIQVVEQFLALQRDFPSLGLGQSVAGGSAVLEPRWVPYADNRWLVSVAPAVGNAPPALVALRAREVLVGLEGAASSENRLGGTRRIVIGEASQGEALGPALPGLQVVFPIRPDEILARQWSSQRAFYVVSLLLVVSMALFAAYLLWRDVQRELRLASLRSQFVSSVSHELKTPLTAIRMFAETLALGRAQRAQVQGEYLETIVNETQRLTRLLNNVLDFSKIEQGKKMYRIEPTRLTDAVQAAARAMKYPLAQQGFELRVEIEPDLPMTRGDADAIEQAVLNLLTNAMKYSGAAREIELTLRHSGGQALIEVRDHGIGISAADQPHVFEKFYRVAAAQRVPGTGLGLTLVQHIARAHGGEVEVRSELGKGSTFTLHIPLEEPI